MDIKPAESAALPVQGRQTSLKQNIRRQPHLSSRQGSPWRSKNLRRKQPLVRPPLPPKPEVLSDRRGQLFMSTSRSTDQLSQTNNDFMKGRLRKFSTPVQNGNPKLSVTRSQSSQAIGSERETGVLGKLVAQRKQFFHQLSVGSTEEQEERTAKVKVIRKTLNSLS